MRLDITESDQVAAVAERVRSDPAGRPLRAVVNNAGIAVAAPVELIPLASGAASSTRICSDTSR